MARIIDAEPWLIESIRNRKTVLMKKRGPIREAALDFAESVARILRSREFWAQMVASAIVSPFISPITETLNIKKLLRL